jgi:hypothetical protein
MLRSKKASIWLCFGSGCLLILLYCREMEYDGIVLESWSRWAAYGILHDPEMRNKVTIDLYQATFRAHFFEDLIFIKTY